MIAMPGSEDRAPHGERETRGGAVRAGAGGAGNERRADSGGASVHTYRCAVRRARRSVRRVVRRAGRASPVPSRGRLSVAPRRGRRSASTGDRSGKRPIRPGPGGGGRPRSCPCPARPRTAAGGLAGAGCGRAAPFGDGTFGAALVVVTLCFADDPLALLAEARRVLRPRGVLVLGMVFADSPWRAWYRQKGEEGHTFCPAARFLTGRDVHEMLGAAGFRCPPGPIHPPPVADGHTHAEPVLEGEASGTGFVALQAG